MLSMRMDYEGIAVERQKVLLPAGTLCYSRGHSPIAQLVEHSTVNRIVPGSSPGRGANICVVA